MPPGAEDCRQERRQHDSLCEAPVTHGAPLRTGREQLPYPLLQVGAYGMQPALREIVRSARANFPSFVIDE